jgi:hypothetical protein
MWTPPLFLLVYLQREATFCTPETLESQSLRAWHCSLFGFWRGRAGNQQHVDMSAGGDHPCGPLQYIRRGS